MPQERPRDNAMLVRQRPVPVITAPLGHSLHCSTHALPCCPDMDRELPITTSRTDVRKTEEVEGLRLALALPSETLFGKSPEGNQPCLPLVQFQPIFRKPLPEHPGHPLSVLSILKAGDEIIRVADEIHLSTHPRLHHRLHPFVEDVVQVHVGQDGAAYASHNVAKCPLWGVNQKGIR